MIPRFHASTAPQRPAIVLADTGEQVSWAEVEARSAALATWLHGRGLRPGAVVLLALPNDVRWAEIAWACWRSGLVLAPVDVHLGPDELRSLVEQARPAAVIVGDAVGDTVAAAVAAAGVEAPAWLVVGGSGSRDSAGRDGAARRDPQPVGADDVRAHAPAARRGQARYDLSRHRVAVHGAAPVRRRSSRRCSTGGGRSCTSTPATTQARSSSARSGRPTHDDQLLLRDDWIAISRSALRVDFGPT